ncbi:uncharacterized protein BO66DRAFT_118864 [Aspergillus aculeatinus CBS 121060]|uniref:Uncharacterized protein n=1 Tax=Aspergillus aculeatinus CBS 121060 TaxID=1448322 RepID=A0ACD1H5U5_9EURO|nr:hypothetical protein BO66DRAFT_118864 [Aspergillus aculeatinus CBS 121060]RAH68982.1 hypothetical protein BO66DRAFT_118864 [Aspergillus aculeatinus CBS 121060]
MSIIIIIHGNFISHTVWSLVPGMMLFGARGVRENSRGDKKLRSTPYYYGKSKEPTPLSSSGDEYLLYCTPYCTPSCHGSPLAIPRGEAQAITWAHHLPFPV